MKRLSSLLIVVLVLSLLAGCGKKEAIPEEIPVPVETTRAQLADLAHTLNTSGEITADAEAAVAPKASGRVAAVRVKVGDRVSKGQVLVELEAAEAQNMVAQAEAGLGIAGANVDRARLTLADAQLNYERSKELFDAQAISRSQLEQAESGLKNARVGLKLAEEQHKQSLATLNNARESLSNFRVTSPLAGLVASVNVAAGEMAGPQLPVVTVVQLDPMKIKVSISENFISAIKPGGEVPVVINALGKNFTGVVTSVGPKADPVTRAFPVEIKLANQQGEIKSGMVAGLLLSTGLSAGVVAVPVDAVMEREGQFSVFVVEDGRVREIGVKVGITAGQLTEIKEGLEAGQEVVVKGNRLVADGQQVRVVNGPGGAGK